MIRCLGTACFILLNLACLRGPAHVPVPTQAPLREDVVDLDGIMKAFYDVVNVAPDGPRQWGRDRTLYSPWIRFVGIGHEVDIWDHQRLVDETEPMVRAGFREREIHRVTHRYGNIATVLSTYETESGPEHTLSRGVNSLQLYHDGRRWWIASVTWQSETKEHPIPVELLKP
ncbi:hypothetical protein [Geothrix sp. PMB-07]|uniref:hypothetical protein n=1 Tax=Geothrix sp. PMB-07 TaxID=3068640 RepID=UPI0027419917|nr:hypothetical protein [Geothrix sp. PMB-07]WLT30996.1 hypothetical protein Q9293_14860 [Geothrix sp. PMB-07]